MPEYNIESGGETYTVNAENQQAAHAAVANQQFGGAVVGLCLFLITFVPIIAAKLAGLLWGLLLKLGFVGKIITTGLMVVVGPMIILLPMTLAQDLFRDLGPAWSGMLIVGSALLIPAWYYLYHYDVVKEMGAVVFSVKTERFAKFLWFGGMAGVILSFIIGPVFGGFISIGSAIAGLIDYFVSIKPYAEQAAAKIENPQHKKKAIIMLAMLGLTVLIGIVGVVKENQKRAASAEARAEMIKENPVLAIIDHPRPFEATIVSPVTGTIIPGGSTVKIPAGEVVTVTSFTRIGGSKSTTYHASVAYKGWKEISIEDLASIKPQE